MNEKNDVVSYVPVDATMEGGCVCCCLSNHVD